MLTNVLILDDEPGWIESIKSRIGTGYKVSCKKKVDEIEEVFKSGNFDVAIINWDLTPDTDPLANYGIRVVDYVQRHHPEVCCIVVTGNADSTSLQAKYSKFFFLTKGTSDINSLPEILESVAKGVVNSLFLKLAKELGITVYQLQCLLKHPLVTEEIRNVQVENSHLDEIEAFEAVIRPSRAKFKDLIVMAKGIDTQYNSISKKKLEARKKRLEDIIWHLEVQDLQEHEKKQLFRNRELLWETEARLGLFARISTPLALIDNQEGCSEDTMSGIDPEVYRNLCETLVSFDCFSNNESLRRLFNDKRLNLWLARVPEENHVRGRVEAIIDYLHNKSNVRGENALALLLCVLRDRMPADSRYEELGIIAAQLGLACEQAYLAPKEEVHTPTPLLKKAKQTESIITWLHISDLHFKTEKLWNSEVVLQHLIDDVENRKEIAPSLEKLDFIFVTGDIAFSGKKEQYQRAMEFLKKLKQVTGVRKDRTFVVPGNHDVDRAMVSPLASRNSLVNRDLVSEIYHHHESRLTFLSRFDNYFDSFILHYLKHLRYGNGDLFYIARRKIQDFHIDVLGLNSAWTSFQDEEYGKLILGDPQVRAALNHKYRRKNSITIALLHHPLEWLIEFDREDCEPQLYSNCDFILHGHLHRTGITTLHSPGRDAMILGAGACYMGRNTPNAYNYVEFNPETRKGVVYLREYSDRSGGHWTSDTRTYKGVDGKYEFDLPPRN